MPSPRTALYKPLQSEPQDVNSDRKRKKFFLCFAVSFTLLCVYLNLAVRKYVFGPTSVFMFCSGAVHMSRASPANRGWTFASYCDFKLR